MKKRNIGILSSIGHPLLPYFVETLNKIENVSFYLILDKKKFSEKNKKIFESRTKDNLKKKFVIDSIKTFRTNSHNSKEVLDFIKNKKIFLLLNCGTPRKLERDIINSTDMGILNIHPGLLPKYKGSSCVEWSIYNEDPIGISAHFMSEEYDSGPIIQTLELPIKKTDTYENIRTRVYLESIDFMKEIVEMLILNEYKDLKLIQQKPSHIFRPIGDNEMAIVLKKINDS